MKLQTDHAFNSYEISGKAYQFYNHICYVIQILALLLISSILIAIFAGYISDIDLRITFAGQPPQYPPPAYGPSAFTNIPPNFPIGMSEFALLMDHDRDSKINDKEKEIVREIFDYYDADNDGLLNFREFSEFMKGTLQTEKSFALIDFTNDGVVHYNELVYVLTIFNKDCDRFRKTDFVDLLQEIFGDNYDPKDEPEFIAQVFFEEFDPDKNGVITRQDYIRKSISNEWGQYNKNSDEFVNFKEFLPEFFDSPIFANAQEIYKETQSGEFDAKGFVLELQNSVKEDIEEIDLQFPPHKFDGIIASTRRRQIVILGGLALVALLALVIGVNVGMNAAGESCYDDHSTIHVLNKGAITFRDVTVGDYVYDGAQYTKVYWKRSHTNHGMTEMLAMKYGNPRNDYSVVMTPYHLLYKQGYDLPLRADNIKIGDILHGIKNYTVYNDEYFDNYYGYDYNYTVYDIDKVYRQPINAMTMSGDLWVNGIKTSVFSHSVEERDRLQNGAAIIRWLSNNVDEDLTSYMLIGAETVFYQNYERFVHRSFAKFICSYPVIGVPAVLLIPFFVIKKISTIVKKKIKKD